MTNKDAQLDSYKDIATLSVVIAKLKRGYIFVFQEKEKGFQTNFHKKGLCVSTKYVDSQSNPMSIQTVIANSIG